MSHPPPPVSPLLCMPFVSPEVPAGNDEVDHDHGGEEPAVDFTKAKLKDPIIGMEQVLSNANGDLALPAVPMKAPNDAIRMGKALRNASPIPPCVPLVCSSQTAECPAPPLP